MVRSKKQNENGALEKSATIESNQNKIVSTRKTKIIKDVEDEKLSESSLVLARTIAHSRRVEVFADVLFKALQSVHELSPSSHKILSLAAQLHDIGWIYGQKGHHKQTAKIIYNFVKDKKFVPSDDSIDANLQKEIQSLLAKSLNKVDKETALMIATVARYHRKSPPLSRHSMYNKLDKEQKLIVRKLASILRIADALDYSHLALVKNIHVKIDDRLVTLTLDCTSSCIAEKNRVYAKKELFQDTFQRILECEIGKKNKKNKEE